MKKVIHNIGFVILSMMFAMQSCSDQVIDEGNQPVPDDDVMVPISLDLRGLTQANTYSGPNYGFEMDTTGTAAENAVTDIIVYVFDNTFTCEKILHGPNSPVGPEMVKIGTKHFIAVVNAQQNVPSLFPLPTANPSTVSYSVLRKTLSNALTSLPASPFLMVGEKLNYPVVDQKPITQPYKIPIEVERACAKVTMSFTKSLNAATHNITLDSIVMYQGANRIYLFDKPDTDPTTYTLSKLHNSFSPSASVQNSPTFIKLDSTFYTYASACGSDKSKAAYFKIYAAINSPSNKRTAMFYLAEYEQSPGDTVYDIRRNYWYDVIINMTDPGMDSLYITVNVSRWNVADVQDTIAGGGADFNPAVPFKLVKNYTAPEITANPTFAAINKHSKGASWVKVKATSGTPWSIKLKDNSPRNTGVIGSLDGGANWITLSNTSFLSGTGNNLEQTVYIYRPYRENAEPELGPALYAEVGGQYKHDLIIQPRDTMPIPTNSYILRPQLSGAPVNATRAYIPLAGVYRYWEDYIYNNGDSIPNGPISAQLLWKDNTGTVINTSTLSVINPNKRDSAYIYAEAGPAKGNAVVVMRVGGTIYWSFHLWVTEYNPYEAAGQKLYSTSKTVFMDRNLGALSNVYDATGDARGLYYQFGRKDPFPKGNNWTASFVWYNSSGGAYSAPTPGVVPNASGTFRPLSAIPASINDPTKFYTMGLSPNYWSLSKEDMNIWSTAGGNKTAFDPCPEGWRIPKQANLGSTNSPWNSLSNFLTTTYQYGRYNPTVGYYPFSGYLGNSFAITGVTTEAYYWTSWNGASPNYSEGTGLNITTTTVNNAPTINKAYGASVRCVVDLNYLLNKNGVVFGNDTGTLINAIKP